METATIRQQTLFSNNTYLSCCLSRYTHFLCSLSSLFLLPFASFLCSLPFLFLAEPPPMASITGTSISLKLSTTQATGIKFSNLRSVSVPTRGRSFPSLRLQKGASRFNVSCAAKPDTVDKVCAIVRKQLALAPETVVNGESKFVALGADSLDTVEIVMGLEEEFGISVEEETAQSIVTVQDAADLIENLIEKKA